MQLDPQVKDIHAPILESEAQAALSSGLFEDSPALRLVVADTLRAENWENQKAWVLSWNSASILYQSPFTQSYWEGSMVPRANVPFYTVATAVNSLVPQIMQGLFYENPPFMIQKRPKTKETTTKAIGALLAYQLEEINFRQEIELGIRNAILFGTSVWKWGWEVFTRERKMYRRTTNSIKISHALGNDEITNDEDIEEVTEEEYVDRPFFEHIINLRHVLVDPALAVPDIRKAKYVVHRMFLTFKELDKLRERPGYNIPPQEELISLFFPPKEQVDAALGEQAWQNPLWDARAEARYEDSTDDPFNQPLEVLERWDNESVIVVLQKKVVICNDQNPYGKIPFFSVGWWDVPEAFWSMGLAKTIGAEQRLQQGITNTWLDNAALNLNGVYVRILGKGVQSQSIRISPGKIVNIEAEGKFDPLKRLDPVPEAGQHLALSQARVQNISGANEIASQGDGSAAHSNMARSATGASAISAGAASRPQDFVEKLANQVMIPLLQEMHELNRALLPPTTIRYILDEELEHAYFQDGGDLIELLNAGVKFSVLAAAKMQARKNMAQALPILVQFLTNEQTTQQLGLQRMKVDVVALMKMFFFVSDWKNENDVILPMTEEEAQRYQQSTPAAQNKAKAQAASAQMQQQHANKLELVDNENMARAGREVLRHAIETGETPEAIMGTPGAQGFGSSA